MMLLSTFSFNAGTTNSHFRTAFFFTIILLIITTTMWELHWRRQGYTPNIKDSAGLWAKQRSRIINEGKRGTVIIGSSRVLFGLNLEVWRDEIDKTSPIQLSSMKSAPIVLLRDIANDKHFSGFLVIGVTPGPFFLGNSDIAGLIINYQNETLAQAWGQQISQSLENRFAFMDSEANLLSSLEDINWPNRPIKMQATLETPKLANMLANRQANMWLKLEQDTSYQNKIKSLWSMGLKPLLFKQPESKKLQRIEEVTSLVKQIRSRGGEVIFVRLPSSGLYRTWESNELPKNDYWNRLLSVSNARGFHFEDYEKLRQFKLPDTSHLANNEAIAFTRELAKLIKPVYLKWHTQLYYQDDK